MGEKRRDNMRKGEGNGEGRDEKGGGKGDRQNKGKGLGQYAKGEENQAQLTTLNIVH